ncbi:cytochrome P450 [Mycolicibacterium komossense]|uniref:Cytochrome P450 n=1 Tax=Mycolicibacterium komossense TaxID=1779 RepID=A0ABT3CKM2_9MYCO|nr:cytochrome P450 [Mycolicibacterium komossense]MCV7230005.1 cytochrome P450 [Mycolicibacterium komossense]
MTTFEELALSFDDDDDDDGTDVPPTNDVAAQRPHDELNVSSDAFWALDLPERDLIFRTLREERPVSWQPAIETAVAPDPDDPGFWAVVRHGDIIEASQRSEVFVSRYGVMFDMLPPVFLEMAMSFLAMDNPKHNKVRRLVASAFTPRQIKRIDDDIASRAKRIVAAAAQKARDGAAVDFVGDISVHLPVEMFGDMFGVPEELRAEVAHAADETQAWADPVLLGGRDPAEVQVEGALKIHEITEELIAARRAEPADDLLTSLVNAEIDGEHLSDFEICATMVLCAVAGTDTTRHTASFAAKALTDFPAQRQWLWDDFESRIGTAIEEFLRWGSVVQNFRRTAVSEYTLGGQQILPGDKVVLMYSSGNRDAAVFDDPDAFKLDRNPNPHIAFGGGGTHFCLGNQLSKSMLRSLFRELYHQMPDFVAGEPTLVKTNFIRGIVSMPFDPKLPR